MSGNPYQAPKAEVVDFQPDSGAGDRAGDPRTVAAGRGLEWFREGWELFAANPGLWIAMMLVMLGVLMAAGFVPIIGFIAQNLVFPLLLAGIALGCDTLRRGETLEFAHLFAGFSRNTHQLLVLGAIYSVGVLVAVIIAMIPMIGLIGGMGFLGSLEGVDPDSLGAAMLLPMLLGVLLMMALTLPLLMAIWFAPALVILDDRPALEAMKLSFMACLKNVLPFLVYGLVGLVLSILATIPLLLGWLVLMPWIYTSSYRAYRDIFFAS